MKKALYLDDQRTPIETIPGYEPWYIVRNFEEFEQWITKNGVPDLISFDHDLADEHVKDYFSQVADKGYQKPDYEKYKEYTGLSCAKWLCEWVQENDLELKACAVHSHNPVGTKNIQTFINNFKEHMGWEANCYTWSPKFEIKE